MKLKTKNLLLILLTTLLLVLGFQLFAFGDAPVKADTGDTVFSIFSIALVFLMTPGLALFYGGMVRKKNVLNTMMNSFIAIAIISIQWVLFGYTIAFGPDFNGWHLFGELKWLGFNGVGGAPNPDYAATIPHAAFAMFQLMFAIITPAIISGSFAERMRFPAFIWFIVAWSTLVYDPLAHWVWGDGGWLHAIGAIDFAGGTVVHISSGVAGLVIALVLGKRKGYKAQPMIPHNIPLVLLGAGLLWFGWFGFNAGSALTASDGLAITALVTTNTAAAAGLLSWVIVEWIHRKKPTALGAVTGGVVGLVAITPAAGFVTPLSAIIIGLSVSPICYYAISVMKSKLGYDDSLDAFGCHGIGGMWGAICTGLFATTSVNPGGANGLFYGEIHLLLVQLVAIVATAVFSGGLSYLILKVISCFTKLRVDDEEEEEGLDVALHGEDAYPDFAPEHGVVL